MLAPRKVLDIWVAAMVALILALEHRLVNRYLETDVTALLIALGTVAERDRSLILIGDLNRVRAGQGRAGQGRAGQGRVNSDVCRITERHFKGCLAAPFGAPFGVPFGVPFGST